MEHLSIESFKLRVDPLNATNYHAWDNDMRVVLCGKGLWKYANPGSDSVASLEDETALQWSDMALECLLISITHVCKSSVIEPRAPRTIWTTHEKTYYSVAEVSVEDKLTNHKTSSLK